MALFWRPADQPRLVGLVSPPMCPKGAEQALRQIFKSFGWELLSERRGEQHDMRQIKAQLRALNKALSGLGIRAQKSLAAAIDDGMDSPDWPDMPAQRMPGALLVLMLPRASARAMVNIPQRTPSPSPLTEAARNAVRSLVDLYCSDGRPRPYLSRQTGAVKHDGALRFAWECLAAWGDRDVIEVSADELVWCVVQ